MVCLLSIGKANAVQISLSEGNVEKYFQILEVYVLPFLVVSTVVLLCGYIASKIYNRRLDKAERVDELDVGSPDLRDRGTAAFLRELKTTPPIKDPTPDREPRLRLRFRQAKKEPTFAGASPAMPESAPDEHVSDDRVDEQDRDPLLLRQHDIVPYLYAKDANDSISGIARLQTP